MIDMQRMTKRLKELVWCILCEGIDHPEYHIKDYIFLYTKESYTQEEIDFCIEWMKNKLGV